MSEKYYIKYVGEAGAENYIPNQNLYWGGSHNRWVKTAEAHSYTKEEAFREISRILHERYEFSELVLEEDLPTPEKLETDQLD